MSGIFDVFTILFKSDTEGATEGVDKLDKEVDSLGESVQKTDSMFNKLDNSVRHTTDAMSGLFSLSDAAKNFLGYMAGYFAVSNLAQFASQSVSAADQLDEFTASVDGNIEQISAWGDAVKMSGGDMASFQATFMSLSADFTSFAVKGKSKLKPFFDELGISMLDANGKARDVMSVLPELADAFGKLGKQESMAFGKKIGLDGGTIRALQGGREELEKLLKRQKELGVITAEQAAVSAEWNDALDDTAHAFRSLFLSITTEILPAFTSILTAIQDVTIFLREHSGFAIGFFGTIAAVIVAVYLPAIVSAIAATAALVAPFLPVIAVVAALATAIGLLYDDFITWTEGGKSLLGELIGEFDKWTPVIEGWKQIFENIKDAVLSMWDAILNPLDTLDAASDKLAAFFEPIKDMMPSWDEIKQSAAIAFSNTQSPLTGLTAAAIGAGGVSGNTTTLHINKVDVNTQATDADGVAREFNSAMQKQIKQTQSTYDDGVAY